MSLNNQSNRLSDLGRREKALAAIEEAVKLYRGLTAARPEQAQRPGASRGGAGRHQEAVDLVLPMLERAHYVLQDAWLNLGTDLSQAGAKKPSRCQS
jgi:tetratricopeptide (TPR) repeat protein